MRSVRHWFSRMIGALTLRVSLDEVPEIMHRAVSQPSASPPPSRIKPEAPPPKALPAVRSPLRRDIATLRKAGTVPGSRWLFPAGLALLLFQYFVNIPYAQGRIDQSLEDMMLLVTVGIWFVIGEGISLWLARLRLSHHQYLAGVITFGLFVITAVRAKNIPLNMMYALNTLGFIWLFVGALQFRFMVAALRYPGMTYDYVRGLPAHISIGIAALFFSAVALAICFSFYGGMPSVNDGMTQYVHAKLMLRDFAFTGKVHPLQQFFDFGWMVRDGDRWYSQFPPGYTLLLAIGHIIHAPWLINPLLGAGTVAVVYLLGREMFSHGIGLGAALLTAFCPLFIFYSSEFLSHATGLFFSVLFCFFFVRAYKYRLLRDALLAGACLGYVFITRPLSAIGLGVPFAVFGVLMLRKDWREWWALCVVMLGAFLLLAGFQALFNYFTTGDALQYGYIKRQGMAHMPGFGKTMGFSHTNGREFEFPRALQLLWQKMQHLNRDLFAWPVPSLCLMGFALLSRRLRYVWLLIGAAAGPLLAHLTWPFDYPRFGYEGYFAVMLLTAVGIDRLCVLARHALQGKMKVGRPHVLVPIIILVFYLLSWNGMGSLPRMASFFDNAYKEGRHTIYYNLEQQAQPPALVFIPQEWKYYSFGFTNPPSDDAPVIYARSRGEENKRLIDYYPHRNAYIELENRLVTIDRKEPGEIGPYFQKERELREKRAQEAATRPKAKPKKENKKKDVTPAPKPKAMPYKPKAGAAAGAGGAGAAGTAGRPLEE